MSDWDRKGIVMLDRWPSMKKLREFQQMPHAWLEAKARESKSGCTAGVVNLEVPTPAGAFGVSASAFGICSVFFPGNTDEWAILTRMDKYGFGLSRTGEQRAIEAGLELMGYLAQEITEFEVPIDFSFLSTFQKDVYAALRTVPYGTTITYGQLAKIAGHPGKARAVGTVMKNNPMPILVPCHRVVPASGGIGGWAGPEGWKEDLQNFEKHRPIEPRSVETVLPAHMLH